MIVIDTSALIAILDHERTAFFEIIAVADRCLVSAVTYQEAGHVLFARRGADGLGDLDELLAYIDAEIVPHDRHLAGFALDAFDDMEKASIPKLGSISAIARFTLCKGHACPVVVQRRRLRRHGPREMHLSTLTPPSRRRTA